MSDPEIEERPGAGFVGAAALLLTLGGVLLWLVMLSGPMGLAAGLLGAQSNLERAQGAFGEGRFRQAVFETFTAKASAARAEAAFEAGSPVLDLVTLWPRIDDALGELDHFVAAVNHSAGAAEGTLEIWLNALRGPRRVIGPDPNGEGSVVYIDRLEELGGVIDEVGGNIRGAGRELAAVDLDNLPRRLHKTIKNGIEEARDADALIDKAEMGFELLPGILGADGPRTYLLAFQNSAELRGAGGAMLQFEFLTIEDGKPRLAGNRTGTIYRLDQDRRPISIPLPRDAWYVRGIEDAQRFGNSNWSPDWPLSAELAIEYGAASAERCVAQGPRECPEFPEIDGVFAVDPVVVKNLMPGTGPFQQGSFFIRRRNVVDILLNRAYQYFHSPAHRRNFLGNIVDRFFSKMFNPNRPSELVRGMGRSLANKNMQIWMADPEEQAFVERMRWDGSIRKAAKSDYFFVVEQNVGGNKLDYPSKQLNELDIRIDGRDALHTTHVRIFNDVRLPQPRWFLGDSKSAHRPMLNLYVPPTAVLAHAAAGELCPPPLDRACNGRIESPPGLVTWDGNTPAVHRERGKQVWSTTLQIPAQERGTFAVEYRSPNVVTTRNGRNVYRLVVQRQPKAHPERLLVELNLPEEARDVRAPGFKKDGRILRLDRRLESDTVLEVTWRD